jgi:hypothetical protein
MAINVSWQDEDKQIIRCNVEGRWTWDELHRSLRQTIHLMDSVTHKVHFIIDLRNSSFIPNPLGALAQAQGVATPQTHPNEGVKVVVGANPMVRLVYDGYRRITNAMGKNQEFLFAGTLEEAHSMISRERSRLQ